MSISILFRMFLLFVLFSVSFSFVDVESDGALEFDDDTITTVAWSAVQPENKLRGAQARHRTAWIDQIKRRFSPTVDLHKKTVIALSHNASRTPSTAGIVFSTDTSPSDDDDSNDRKNARKTKVVMYALSGVGALMCIPNLWSCVKRVIKNWNKPLNRIRLDSSIDIRNDGFYVAERGDGTPRDRTDTNDSTSADEVSEGKFMNTRNKFLRNSFLLIEDVVLYC